MNKLLLTIALALLVASCSTSSQNSKVDAAKELIQSHLQKNLDDPKSYEAGEFGQLDSITKFEESGQNINYVKHGVLPPDSVTTPRFFGYRMTHDYRAKNKMGGLEKKRSVFYLSPDMKFVITEY